MIVLVATASLSTANPSVEDQQAASTAVLMAMALAVLSILSVVVFAALSFLNVAFETKYVQAQQAVKRQELVRGSQEVP